VRDGVTVAAMFPQTFKDRSVQVGEPYVFPRAGIDPLGLDRDALARTLRGAKGQVVRVLASILNLGGTYAEELCLRAGIDKETKVKDISDPQVDALYTALNNIAVAVDQERRPAVVFREGHAIDATPVELVQYRDLERRGFPTFNGALSHYLTVAEPETATAENVAAKLERRIPQRPPQGRVGQSPTGRGGNRHDDRGHGSRAGEGHQGRETAADQIDEGDVVRGLPMDDLVGGVPDPGRSRRAHQRPTREEAPERGRPLRACGRARRPVDADQRWRTRFGRHAAGGVRI